MSASKSADWGLVMNRFAQLLPETIQSTLPALYSQDHLPLRDQIARVKFFTPDSSWTWYATEDEADGDDFLFFGYVIGYEREAGYFRLSELALARGPLGLAIERDVYFKPTALGTLCPELAGDLPS
jgi:hypothetical protein